MDKLLDVPKKKVLTGTFVRYHNGIVFVFLKSLSVRKPHYSIMGKTKMVLEFALKHSTKKGRREELNQEC